MLESKSTLLNYALSPKSEKALVFALLSLYVVINITFGFLDNATWDDDCPTRIYNAMNAFNDPKQFISLWNRPLFMVIFAPLVPLGKDVVFVVMVLISALSGYFLYLGAKRKEVANAFMLIPFLLFQTFYFSVSRNAETEPLAVALICFGFYFLSHKKWLAFAIVGGLLPLARLELAVFLVIWAFFLLKDKQYKLILLLGAPVLLWNVAGGIIADDFLYVLHQTVGKDNSTNRYGHTTFEHYFERYIYLIGPVVYLFFLLGLLYRFYSKKFDLFVFWQFIGGFMLYVVFSWKFNMGNAAGFLRNLIPLAPLTALLALDGYNFLWSTFLSFSDSSKEVIQADVEKDFEVLNDEHYNKLNAKNRKQYQSRMRKWEELNDISKKGEEAKLIKLRSTRYIKAGLIAALGVPLTVTVYLYNSFEMEFHHNLLEDKNFTNFYITGGLIVMLLLTFLLSKYGSIKKQFVLAVGLLITAGAISFTALTEPPNKNMNPERDTMQEVSDFYISSYISEQTTYVNHVWFFWANELDKFDTLKYKAVTIEHLNNAAPGEICVFDTHYSHRLGGDVPLKWFKKQPEWVELTRFIAKNNAFQCAVYQKVEIANDKILSAHDKFLSQHPANSVGYYNRGRFHKKMNRYDLAIKDFNTSLQDSLPYFYPIVVFNRGLTYFKKREYKLAIKDFKNNFAMNDTMADATFNVSSCYLRMGKSDSALIYLNKTLQVNPKYENAYLNKAKVLKSQGKKEEAIDVISKLISLYPKKENVVLQRAQLYYENKDWQKCINDLTIAVSINAKNSNSFFIRGICYQNLNNKDLGCKEFKTAIALGDKNAGQYLNLYCK